MIIGRVQARAGEDKIYDYSACMYPEGMIGGETTCFFVRDAVDTVYFIGFQDPDEMKFRHHVLDQLGELEIKDGKIHMENLKKDYPKEQFRWSNLTLHLKH